MSESEGQTRAPLNERSMALIEQKLKHKISVDVNLKAQYEEQLKSMDGPVIEVIKGEPVKTKPISPEDLADAAKILGEEPEVEREQDEAEPIAIEGDVRELRWDENLDRDLNLAAREPRRWKDPADHSKGPLPNDERAGYQQKINEATARLGTRGYDVHILKDRDGRKRTAGARRIIFDGMNPTTIGMTTEEAEQILNRMNIDVNRVRVEAGVPGNEPAGGSAPDPVAGEIEKKKSVSEKLAERTGGSDKVISETQARDRMERVEEYKDPRLKAKLYRTLAETLAKQGAKSDLVNEIMDKANEYISGGEKLTNEEQDRIIDYCYKQIFEMGEKGAYNAEAVIRSLVNPDGFIVTELGKMRGNIDRDTLKMIKELGLDNWIGIRETLRSWEKLRSTEEVVGASLSEGLFPADYVEKFFAGVVQPDGNILPRSMKVPEMRNGKLEILEIPDIEVAVSKAMVDLRKFFEGKTVDHYNIIQSREQREQVYEMLKINKHVAEVAFTELTSHLMLTEFSADDIFLMMVDRTKKEIKLYNIMGNKSPAVRAAVHSLQTAGWSHSSLFTENRKLTPEAQAIIEDWLSHSLPRHLIPTGMTGMEEAFNEGHWLRERVRHLKTGAQRATEVSTIKESYLRGRTEGDLSEDEKSELSNRIMKLDKASDTDTRLEMMRRALIVLTGIKEVTTKPESDLVALGKLKASLLIHYKVNLKAAGWVNNDMTCDPYFDFVADGTRPVKEGEWASKAMVAISKIDMFTKSYADAYCEKPKDMNALAEMAVQILSQLPQTEEEAYLGFERSIRVKHRKEFADYFSTLWRDNMTLVKALGLGNQYVNLLLSAFSPRTETVKFPNWYNFGVPPKPEIMQMMAKDVNSTAWPDKLRNIDLSR